VKDDVNDNDDVGSVVVIVVAVVLQCRVHVACNHK
jgi:hypothetical protein